MPGKTPSLSPQSEAEGQHIGPHQVSSNSNLSKRLGLSVYFAQPYCSWQRGTNEHINGLLRQFLPKGIDLRTVSWQELEHYSKLINDRPRKRLNYRTPAELFETRVAIES